MSGRPKLLDLFCCAGGAARGYQRAGFLVVGVDNRPQPRYAGDAFYQADALDFLREHGRRFHAIHASPPCQLHTEMMEIRTQDVEEMRGRREDHITSLRPILQEIGVPFVIENVKGAVGLMRNATMLCGTMFGLRVLRHRYFETNFHLPQPAHPKHAGTVAAGQYLGVYGTGGAMWADKAKTRRRSASRAVADWREAMQMPWAAKHELTEAIPPAYTEYVGRFLMEALRSPSAQRGAP